MLLSRKDDGSVGGSNNNIFIITTDANIIESQDGVGVVKLGSTSLSIKSNNVYFPFYDNTDGGYRLFQYELINRGNDILHHFKWWFPLRITLMV